MCQCHFGGFIWPCSHAKGQQLAAPGLPGSGSAPLATSFGDAARKLEVATGLGGGPRQSGPVERRFRPELAPQGPSTSRAIGRRAGRRPLGGVLSMTAS